MGNVIKLTFKDPDGVHDSIEEFIENNIPFDLEEDERENLIEIRRDKIIDKLAKFIKYSEYLSVEIDLDKGTARVIENK